MNALDDLKKKSSLTPLEWVIVEHADSNVSIHPERNEQAAADLARLQTERDEAIGLLSEWTERGAFLGGDVKYKKELLARSRALLERML